MFLPPNESFNLKHPDIFEGETKTVMAQPSHEGLKKWEIEEEKFYINGDCLEIYELTKDLMALDKP